MGLLAPLFLLGLAAIALPLWLHRLQTESADRKPFSSAMLLESAEERVHVRKKLKYLLLMAFRIALLVLVALAFAKPFLSAPPQVIAGSAAGSHLLLVDTSASMARAGVFEQALEEGRRVIRDAPGDAVLQVVAADDRLTVPASPTLDRSEAVAVLESLTPSALRLDYGEVMRAIERVAASLPQPVTLHFVSDYQSTGMPVRFSDLVARQVADFTPHVVGTGEPFNWSGTYLRGTADGIVVGLNGAGARERVGDVEVLLNGEVVEARGLSQTGPQSLTFEMPDYEPGDNRVEVRIVTDDDLAVDNRWFHVVDNRPPAPIPLITAGPRGLPVTYLAAALESAGDYQVELHTIGDFDPRVMTRYRWAIIDDIGAIDAVLADELRAFVEGGGNLLAFAGERAAGLETLPVSGHAPAASSLRDAGQAFLAIGQLDTRHPALADTDGWQSVRVERHLPLETGDDDEVLIRLENNEPFLIEQRIGAGKLLLLPGSLDNRWSDLPVRPVFVSFVIEAARYLSGVNDIARTYTTGANLPLAVTGRASGQVVDPDGNTVLSLADTTREQQIKLNKPGFYEVYTLEGETIVAANPDPRESDLQRISQDVLDRWQAATDFDPATNGGTAVIEETRTVELWHWLLLLLALVVIGESILGNMHLSPRQTASRA